MKTAVLFTCSRDLPMAAVTAAALLARGVSVVAALDSLDTAEPNPAAVLPEGVRLVRTEFARNGNLNGKECVRGILATLAAEAAADASDFVIKVDSDTLVGPAFLARLDAPGAPDCLGFADENRLWYGVAYALRVSKLPTLAALAADLPPSATCPEDQTIGTLCRRAGFTYETRALSWHNYRAGRAPSPAAFAATFGFMSGMPGVLTDADRRAHARRTMAAFRFNA